MTVEGIIIVIVCLFAAIMSLITGILKLVNDFSYKIFQQFIFSDFLFIITAICILVAINL